MRGEDREERRTPLWENGPIRGKKRSRREKAAEKLVIAQSSRGYREASGKGGSIESRKSQ